MRYLLWPAALLVIAGCSAHHDNAAPAAPPTTNSTLSTLSTTRIASLSSPGVPGPTRLLALQRGPYGFLIPQGWKETPLQNSGGPAGFAHFDDPASTAAVDYETSGGEIGIVDNPDGTANLAGALGEVRCPVTSHNDLSATAVAYSCSGTPAGLEVNGVIIVAPSRGGWKSLQTTLPASQHETATKILNSFS